MKRPKLNLPLDSRPWGRWVEDNLDATAAEIANRTQDSSIAGSVLSGRADLLQAQIAATPGIAAIYERQIPPFSVTRSFSPTVVSYVYDSPVTTFNPPRPDLPYNYTVIANMNATGVNFPFARSLLRTNGLENMLSHENLQPGYDTSATFSIAGSGTLIEGGRVDVQAAIMAQAPGTVSFSSIRVWCMFSGSVL